MVDYNKIYTSGDYKNGKIISVVEIPKGSINKIEYNRDLHTFELDRVDPEIFPKPTNYGFIPQTLDDDGDELDTLIVADESLPLGVVVKAKIIGVLKFEDDGELDHKIICVPDDNRNNGNLINSVDDLGEKWKEKISYHFNHYKDLKKAGTTNVIGFGDISEAKEVIEECIERYKNK